EEAQRIARIGSWNWDIPRDQISWSAEFARIYGFEADAVQQDFQASLQLVHPDDRERVAAITAQALQDHQPVSYDFRVVDRDGAVRFCEAHVGVFTDDAGTPVRMAGTVQDITDRKVMEEDLFRATTARAAAEGANVAKGKFLASMSHELRTP